MCARTSIALAACCAALLALPTTATSQEPARDASVAATASPPLDATAAAGAGSGLDDEARSEYERLATLDASFVYRTGTVGIGDGLATLTLPPSLRYLDPRQTERLLVEGWGHPEGAETLGMIVAADASPLSGDSWGVVLSFQQDGFVSDAEAFEIDYDVLLREMQTANAKDNALRVAEGLPRVELVGWAEAPRYEPATHTLVWAKELAFEGKPHHTLNYHVRVLGRRGLLVLNAVANMDQLGRLQAVMPDVIAAIAFDPGQRYRDHESGEDGVAPYGFAALVAGGTTAKADASPGLSARLADLAFAAAKLALPALLIVFLVRRFGRRNGPGSARGSEHDEADPTPRIPRD